MTTPRLDIDFSDPALLSDPFPTLDEIRTTGRVVWNDVAKAWMVAGYADCDEIRLDTKGERFAVPGANAPDVFFWFESPAISNTEGAAHRRLRGGLAKYFTPTAMKEREQRIAGVVDDVLASLVAGRDHFRLDDFTKIPVVVVAELLGIVEERHDDFRRWTTVLVDNIAFGNEPPEVRRMMDEAVAEAKAYLIEEIDRHRRERPDDLLTVMLELDWTDEEIRSVALNLLLAGYDTTAKLIGLALEALEDHPDQRRLLVDDPALIPGAVEEVLRWLGPTLAIVRIVEQDDAELAGHRFKAGDVVYPMLGAANRDPARWHDPERFDVLRAFKPNLGFGSGVHVCIGAALARLEVRIALEALLRVAPEYHLRDVSYGKAFFARGPETGIIEVGATTAG